MLNTKRIYYSREKYDLSNYKHKEKEQHSDLYSYTSEEDTSLYARWIIKRDVYGNIVSVSKHYEDPIHELLDDAKENTKYFTFAPGQN